MSEQTTSMSNDLLDRVDWAKGNGLVPLIVQHHHDGRVLMLGYSNREALQQTLSTGEVHFWSRSRQTLWRKGESSGNVLRVVSVVTDCDRDALLCQAVPAGPTCHRGSDSCFDGEGPTHPWLNELTALIDQRRQAGGDGSYVAGLFEAGGKRMAQKVGEEGVETALAAVAGDDDELRNEAADLLFHLLVLLRSRDLDLGDLARTLGSRHRR